MNYAQDTRQRLREIINSDRADAQKMRRALSLVYDLAETLDGINEVLEKPRHCGYCKTDNAHLAYWTYYCPRCELDIEDLDNARFLEVLDLSQPVTESVE